MQQAAPGIGTFGGLPSTSGAAGAPATSSALPLYPGCANRRRPPPHLQARRPSVPWVDAAGCRPRKVGGGSEDGARAGAASGGLLCKDFMCSPPPHPRPALQPPAALVCGAGSSYNPSGEILAMINKGGQVRPHRTQRHIWHHRLRTSPPRPRECIHVHAPALRPQNILGMPSHAGGGMGVAPAMPQGMPPPQTLPQVAAAPSSIPLCHQPRPAPLPVSRVHRVARAVH